MHSSLLLLFLLFQTGSTSQQTVPVFLMDSENVLSNISMRANPFAKMNSSFFAKIIHQAVKRTECIVIFVEDKFSPEDISTKDKYGTPYHHLHRGLLDKKVKYIPLVSEPYNTLSKIFQQQEFNVFFVNSKIKLHLLDTSKYLYVFFQNGPNETRAQSLRKHDMLMQEVYFTVKQLKAGPVVAFYTGASNPVRTLKPVVAPIKRTSPAEVISAMVASEGALFSLSGVYASTFTRRSPFNQLPMIAEEKWTRQKLSTTMSYPDFQLQFNFNFAEDQWLLDNVALLEDGEEVGRTNMGVGAPWSWSYVCGEPLVVINSRDGSTITISHYQIQPIHPKISRRVEEDATEGTGGNASIEAAADGNSTAGALRFGKSINCGPYFTSQILAALMVTYICLCILIYGVLQLYNCGSNDRFDDPHGKELSHTEG